MVPEPRFRDQSKRFWAYVRILSQTLGYTDRKTKMIKNPELGDIKSALVSLGLDCTRIISPIGFSTELGSDLDAYFSYRAKILNEYVRTNLMVAEQAKVTFESLKRNARQGVPVPDNKQKGIKKKPSYFTGIINFLISQGTGEHPCDFDPQKLVTIIREGTAIRTLSRRFDGAFPSVSDPIAVWEIKEYYYTTTFGSRIADAVYETLLDGMELEELRENEGIHVRHYLMVDAYDTWWKKGKSYLCRIVDMLHMGYIDEVLFGKEVVERIPPLTGDWIRSWTIRESDSVREK